MATFHPLRNRRGSKASLILLCIVLLVVAIHVWLDRLYGLRTHVALGYGAVYSVQMTFELLTRYGGALVYAILGWLAIRGFKRAMFPAVYPFVRAVAVFLGWVIGYGLWSLDATAWLLFFKHDLFLRSDPLFHIDYAFYVYRLPILSGLLGRLLFTVILWILFRLAHVAVSVVSQQMVSGASGSPDLIYRKMRRLVWSVVALLLISLVMTVLGRYQTLLDTNNGSFIYGPDFVTAHLVLPFFSWLHIAAIVIMMIAFAWTGTRVKSLFPLRDGFVTFSLRSFKRPLQSLGFLLFTAIIAPVVTGIVNSLYVHPNQNTVELPFIKNTIDATRWGLGIEHVQAKPFQPSTTLTRAAVNREQNALQNVRINDQGQTTSIYNQLQSFKSYFQFAATSVDRYDGSEVYTSARQMNVDNLPVQTWINRTLVYTHGYGLAVSPVNQFDQDGLPTLWAKNTPQETTPPIPTVTRPQVYFGTMNNDVIAPSKQAEFDYPQGSGDVSSHYKGGYGLPIQGNRLLLAIQQGTLRFYTSDQLTPQSQWLFDRNIYQRVADIAPFLRYDQDAFPFVDGSGNVKWMLDAYTQTSNIPYAQSFMGAGYIRNSVKVVMDAYTGETTFYVVDRQDPILKSLSAVYPTLFTTQIPADIALHFRYPRDLFLAQASALTRYHMTDPSAFYNQEDLWAIANQIYQQNETQPRPPVYQMIRMPDQTVPHFVLSELFTPATKDNMNGWLIADNEPGTYGRLSLYQFPQSSLIYGPMQAENQIDADPTISQQLTLWNQQGSQVVRGDVLLVPIGNSLLYVEPVYLVANRQNSLPQLERVIIFNKHVYIDTSLGAALQDLLNGTPGTAPTPNAPQGLGPQPPGGQMAGGGKTTVPANQANLIGEADRLFQQYQSDTAKGDFTAAGNDLKQLGAVLNQLNQKGNVAKK